MSLQRRTCSTPVSQASAKIERCWRCAGEVLGRCWGGAGEVLGVMLVAVGLVCKDSGIL